MRRETPALAGRARRRAALILVGRSLPAEAFVRYLTDDNAPFFWAQTSVPITGYSKDFTQTSMTADQVANALQGAAAAWSKETNSCTYLELVPALSTAPTPQAVNDGHNSLIFHSSLWCHVGADGKCNVDYDASALAVTTDTANTRPARSTTPTSRSTWSTTTGPTWSRIPT